MTTENDAVTEILQSIATFYSVPLPVGPGFGGNGLSQKLSEVLKQELGVTVSANELESKGSVIELANLVRSRLIKNAFGKTLTDIYVELERMAREQYHPKIPYHWCAQWDDFLNVGNWFTHPGSLDDVEIVIRMEDEYRIKISDDDVAFMQTIGATIRYLWERTGGNWGLQLSQRN